MATSADIGSIRFDDDGLVPVVAQDLESGTVLMVAWANREAVEQTLATGAVHFWSRSRGELWKKGETSGNTLALETLHADCDGDTLLALVRPAGPACHTGDATCFGAATRHGCDTDAAADALQRLDAVLASRADERPAGSYTTRLLDDENLRLKKLGEETAELVAALAKNDGPRALEEAADLVYHLLVALRAEEMGLDDLRSALEERAG
ncbi:MAG: bifunctional phosphoribosyl-AMP cyclohydrolase/phosphoribosyl-ATP diphosphatase HisIE [Gemmatimonadetes bacterium]|nr:bifunctional phosphoribosyl-AMP cyclohydrolase/phosphoribosyl-ATP diphosphatase HisIE [Gemmatimonadota bacterium]NNF13337.1 bifunctional phosphoribosyl-AMP cyclohydrolase/phosphoribosyl-ATP diphosphatase HisIE [Gemmatimonadota bacterium]NNL29806.1 bifunctional phosphoribosyl-AMP cyclohydrolase/phosphoribosyl-ATP diphosphatase HisIE [Gemmatimonadota bacterium]